MQTELLEASDGERMDAPAAGTAGGAAPTWRPWERSTDPRAERLDVRLWLAILQR